MDGLDWSTWEKFTNTKEFELLGGNGKKIVFLKVMDKAGNIGGPVSASIVYDSTKLYDDTDNDGYPDNVDDFPNEPTQWTDNDGDNFGDNSKGLNPDAFPDDPNEWLDSDGDNFGDNNDEFPNDSTRWKSEEGPNDSENDLADKEEFLMAYVGTIILIIVIIILMVLFSIIRSKKKGQKNDQEVEIPQLENQPIEASIDEGEGDIKFEQKTLEQQKQQQQVQPRLETATKIYDDQQQPRVDTLVKESIQAPVYCLTCGLQKSFVKDENRYYCNQCQKYD
jgi:hypothetical protein